MREIVCSYTEIEKNLVLESTGYSHNGKKRTFLIIERVDDNNVLSEMERFSLTDERIDSLILALQNHKTKLAE